MFAVLAVCYFFLYLLAVRPALLPMESRMLSFLLGHKSRTEDRTQDRTASGCRNVVTARSRTAGGSNRTQEAT